MAPRETEDNTYAKFWGGKQRALWYVMVFLEWSIVDSYANLSQILPTPLVFISGYANTENVCCCLNNKLCYIMLYNELIVI